MVEAKVRLLAARLRCPLCLGQLEDPPAIASDDPPAIASIDPPAIASIDPPAIGPADLPAPPTTTAPLDPPATCPGCATAYHAACVAELGVACTTLGCAQGPKAPPTRGGRPVVGLEVRPRVGLVVPLVLTWLLYIPWPLGLIAWGWAVWRARRRRRRAPLAAALLLSPFVVVPAWCAVAAVHGYATGTAVLTWSSGGFGDRSGLADLPIDPEVRCRVEYRGLTLGPGLPDLVNELVLRGLARLFGPMARSYTGPLPTRAEVASLLAQAPPTTIGREGSPALRAPVGRPLDPEGFSDGHLGLTLDGEAVDLAIPGELFWQAGLDDRATSGPCVVRTARLDPGGLLVLISVEEGPGGPSVQIRRTLLFDLTSKRAVAALWLIPTLPVGR